MRGKGKGVPMSEHPSMSPADLSALVDQLVKLIVSLCGPADAIMASVATVKILGELAKHECGEEAATQMLVLATERVRSLCVQIEPVGPETDPFVIEPADPFSLPEDK